MRTVCACWGKFCHIVLFCFNFWILFLFAFDLFVFIANAPPISCCLLAYGYRFHTTSCMLAHSVRQKFVLCPYCTHTYTQYMHLCTLYNMGHQNRFHVIPTLVWMVYLFVCSFCVFEKFRNFSHRTIQTDCNLFLVKTFTTLNLLPNFCSCCHDQIKFKLIGTER